MTSPSTDTQPDTKGMRQEALYEFPYHYLPHLDVRGHCHRHRLLGWGFEYLCYIFHAREMARLLKPDSVLEVGCGDGRFIGELKGLAPRRVGIDISERAIAFAKAFHPDVEFTATKADTLDEQFDLVAAIEVLEHIPGHEITPFIRSLASRTKVGGHVMLSVPSVARPTNPKHYRHYDINLLTEQVRASGAPLEFAAVDYVFRDSRLLKAYTAITTRRKWFIDVPTVSSLVWRHVWRSLRHASPETGAHIVSVLTKTRDV